jgi:tRNA (uracil-5-)-methyltransferase TRM9
MEKETWNVLAEGWKNFRTNPFPKTVIELSKTWKPGKILDLACGNARNIIPFSEEGFDCYGIDFSETMIKSAKELLTRKKQKVELKVGDMLKIPYKDNYFDYVICIASFHHLKKEEQKKGLEEVRRVLKPKGKLYIAVWNKWQKRFLTSKKEVKVPWKRRDKTYYRYYYLFNYFELRKLVKRAGFKIERSKGILKRMIELISSN